MHPSTLPKLSLLLGLALWPATAPAVDGVVEINQARALAGGVTAGDAAGFPVTIAAAGSYRLTGNLDVTGQATPEDVTAIEITADSVSLDLNGFSILGPADCTGAPVQSCSGAGSGFGVHCDGPDDVEVRNGVVHGMGFRGVSVTGRSARVLGVRTSHNGSSGIAVSCYGGSVVDSVARQNGGAGITVGAGVERACDVRDNEAYGNAGAGFDVNAPAGVLRGNNASTNGGDGFRFAVGASRWTIRANSAVENTLDGFHVICPSNLHGNVAGFNGGLAYDLDTTGGACLSVDNLP